jgi:hypothetical protein
VLHTRTDFNASGAQCLSVMGKKGAGKTSMAMNIIRNQAKLASGQPPEDRLRCVYVAIGQVRSPSPGEGVCVCVCLGGALASGVVAGTALWHPLAVVMAGECMLSFFVFCVDPVRLV